MQQKLKLETTNIPYYKTTYREGGRASKLTVQSSQQYLRVHTCLSHMEIPSPSATPRSASPASGNGQKAVSRLNILCTENCHFSFWLKKINPHMQNRLLLGCQAYRTQEFYSYQYGNFLKMSKPQSRHCFKHSLFKSSQEATIWQ